MLRPAAVCRQHSPAELPHDFAPQCHVVGLPLTYTVHCSAYAGDPANEAAPATTTIAIQMVFFISRILCIGSAPGAMFRFPISLSIAPRHSECCSVHRETPDRRVSKGAPCPHVARKRTEDVGTLRFAHPTLAGSG